jgi:hypothetical protein
LRSKTRSRRCEVPFRRYARDEHRSVIAIITFSARGTKTRADIRMGNERCRDASSREVKATNALSRIVIHSVYSSGMSRVLAQTLARRSPRFSCARREILRAMHREMMIAARILFTASLRRQCDISARDIVLELPGIIPSERSRDWQRVDSNCASLNRNTVDDSSDSVTVRHTVCLFECFNDVNLVRNYSEKSECEAKQAKLLSQSKRARAFSDEMHLVRSEEPRNLL